jgi:hypothetical protein
MLMSVDQGGEGKQAKPVLAQALFSKRTITTAKLVVLIHEKKPG